MRFISVLLWTYHVTAQPQLVQRLYNAAAPGTLMPFTGCGNGDHAPTAESTCQFFCGITNTWLHLGGSRLDGADSYGNEVGVGLGIQASKKPRPDVFITSKIGPGGYAWPLGYDDTLRQVDDILKNYSTTYIDLILVHGPDPPTRKQAIVPPIDPLCMPEDSHYNSTACRLSTWKALIEVWKAGKVHAVGVSNYNQAQIDEIVNAGMPLPAVNQIYQNPLKAQKAIVQYCNSKQIAIQAYGSFGGDGQTAPVLSNPDIVKIAQEHSVTTSQVVLNWQWRLNISFNPGFSQVPAPLPYDTIVDYMKENLAYATFTLTDQDMKTINALSPDN